MEPVISLTGVTAELGGRPVLRGVDLTVRPGEVVALLGANGSGKSTAVRATVGQVPVSGGELRMFGTAVHRFRDWRRLGYVPQRSTATGGVPATLREVVSAGRLARRGLRPLGRADRAAVDRALDLVGLADRAGDSVDALSGGQHQRVLIARALAGEPELLVLDEPLAGVDLASQAILADTLRAQLDRGATVLLVLHELGPLRQLIDRAVVLAHGRVERVVERPGDVGDGVAPLPEESACHPPPANGPRPGGWEVPPGRGPHDPLGRAVGPTLQTGIL
ncbi:metal ABC transporter ATP-binding protein [Streptomyces hainanensis]|uniref:Metal ABC transporter ATP-binding protein n=1 Tax=Streptomyces hainanensis TaxID=402648 RepID=A0A4R4T3L4_9ACTN|nr:metal ABC transporter ATP-binding protein [Streptomyces hainanensis]TDC68979.1 metal ABC transporter ATP-binding protein [Streptomyces hainanensis]